MKKEDQRQVFLQKKIKMRDILIIVALKFI